MKIFIISFSLFALVGCASAPVVTTPSSLFKARGVATSTVDIDAAFYATLNDCQGVLYGFEQQATTLKWWSVGLQTAGGILGSILLPVAVVGGAAKTVIAALGAGAGFTNTEISVVRNEGLGAADVIRTRASVQAGMQVALTKYYVARAERPVDLNKIAASVDELKVACISYWLASPNAQPIVP